MTLIQKAQVLIKALCALLALLMIIDYSIVGKKVDEEIIGKTRSLEKYYNAGENFHYSFRIHTEHYNFPISERFALLAKESQIVRIEVSLLFKEVNCVEIVKTGHKEVYPFRVISGLILPLLVLLLFLVVYKFGQKVSTLLFVMEIVLMTDLIFLLN